MSEPNQKSGFIHWKYPAVFPAWVGDRALIKSSVGELRKLQDRCNRLERKVKKLKKKLKKSKNHD